MSRIDRELLELAAKAAGLNVEPAGPNGIMCRMPEGEGGKNSTDWPFWVPLADDGDALRLAVELGKIGVTISIDGCRTEVGGHVQMDLHDPAAATRRAIVLAAAEVGRTMP